MTSMIHIDGAQGEGGGQILRSSLALAMVTGCGLTMERVRAGREKPGLMRQHLTAVRAAKEICGATVTGDAIGSSTLTFIPGSVRPGDYTFSVGTAGSATLVLQTVLPPLFIASGPSRLVLEGGTHNPWAPPFDFLQRAFLPLVNRMGPRVTATLERYGFYPAGGGRFVVEIEPARIETRQEPLTPGPSPDHRSGGARAGARGAIADQRPVRLEETSSRLTGFDLLERGEIVQRRGRVLLSNLPPLIAERELEEIARLTGWDAECFSREAVPAQGPGNAVLLELQSEHVTEVFVGFGEHGVKSENVAKRAVDAMRQYLTANVPVGPQLADQLLLPLGISVWQSRNEARPARCSFRTMPLTNHARTQIETLRAFLGISVTTQEEQARGAVLVTVEP